MNKSPSDPRPSLLEVREMLLQDLEDNATLLKAWECGCRVAVVDVPLSLNRALLVIKPRIIPARDPKQCV